MPEPPSDRLDRALQCIAVVCYLVRYPLDPAEPPVNNGNGCTQISAFLGKQRMLHPQPLDTQIACSEPALQQRRVDFED
jgi:hypothetical protein